MSVAPSEARPAIAVVAEPLYERLAQRGSQPLGVIDVRQPRQHYARMTGWIDQRFPLLHELAARYQGGDEPTAAAVVYRRAQPLLTVEPEMVIPSKPRPAAVAGIVPAATGSAGAATVDRMAPTAAGVVPTAIVTADRMAPTAAIVVAGTATAPTAERIVPVAAGVAVNPLTAPAEAVRVTTARRTAYDSPATLLRQSAGRVEQAESTAVFAPPGVTLRVRRQAIPPDSKPAGAWLSQTAAVAPARSDDVITPDQPEALLSVPSSSSEGPIAPQHRQESGGRGAAPPSFGGEPAAQQRLSTRPVVAMSPVTTLVQSPSPVPSHSGRPLPADAGAPGIFRKADGGASPVQGGDPPPVPVVVAPAGASVDGMAFPVAPALPASPAPDRTRGAGFQPAVQSMPAAPAPDRTSDQPQALRSAPSSFRGEPISQQRLVARPAAVMSAVTTLVQSPSPVPSRSGRPLPADADAPVIFRKASGGASPVQDGDPPPAPVVVAPATASADGMSLPVAPALPALPSPGGTPSLIWRKSSAAAIPTTANPGAVSMARAVPSVSYRTEDGYVSTSRIMPARETTVSHMETGQPPPASLPGDTTSPATAPDWEQLIAQVSRRILRQLTIERERRGGTRWR